MDTPSGHVYGSINFNNVGTAFLGSNHGEWTQAPVVEETTVAKKTFEALKISLLYDRCMSRELEVEAPLSGTCQWLFEHPSWKQWDESRCVLDGSWLLCIQGIHGCGKSVLMKSALRKKMQRRLDPDGKELILHHFFNAQGHDTLEKSSLGLYRSLTYQILNSHSKACDLFLEMFSFKAAEGPRIGWTEGELQDFLLQVISLAGQTAFMVFIDALDEVESKPDVYNLVRFLTELSKESFRLNSECLFRVCLAGRPVTLLDTDNSLSIFIDHLDEHARDIERYVHQKLMDRGEYDMTDLKAEICHKAAHAFLWAVLVVDDLNTLDDHGASPMRMRARLADMPKDWSKFFEETLSKNVEDEGRTTLLLQWVLFATRPLTTMELYLAMEYDRLTGQDQARIPEQRTDRYIQSHSCGLVQLTPTQPRKVSLIHETVREFLVQRGGVFRPMANSSISFEGQSHELLKDTCCRAMSTKSAFRRYAATNWFRHAEQAAMNGVPQRPFLERKMYVWKQDYFPLWLEYSLETELPNMTWRQFLAKYNLNRLFECLLPSTEDTANSVRECGDALIDCCLEGNKELVMLLLRRGTNIDGLGRYETPLQAAASRGHSNIVQLLLESGADSNRRCGSALGGIAISDPLQAAVYGNRTDMAEQLLWQELDPVNPNAIGGELQSALHIAVLKGNLRMVELLLKHRASPEIPRRLFGRWVNVLQMAAAYDQLDTVQLLLDYGADITAVGGWGNALQVAVEFDRPKVVELLVHHWSEIRKGRGFS